MTVQPLRATRVLDLDGTLMQCGIYYDQCLAKGAELIEARTGMNRQLAEKLIRECDLAAVNLPGHAWGRDRFPRSFEAAGYAVGRLCGWGIPETEALARGLFTIGDLVFDAEYTLFDGVRQWLYEERAAGWQLVLYTKGDREVQQMKIDKQGLAAYFDAIYIVDKKNVEQLRTITTECNADFATSWMLGDSKKDDIAPAQALGLNTALIDPGNHTWSYNNSEIDPPTLQVTRVADIPHDMQLYKYGMLMKKAVA